MAMRTAEAVSVGLGEPRGRTELVLEMIALRHQIAVLKRSGTRRPCFRRWDRLFWILFSRWWPQWRDSLIIVQPETVLRWRREGWSALWRYRARGRWRGGRPRVSKEVRHLIVRMARDNFIWGAPRIHGELLMLGFKVSEATVSRYMPPRSRPPGPSWRTFLRNQAMAFGHREYAGERSVWVGLRGALGQQRPALTVQRIALRSARRDRAVTHRAASVSGGSRRTLRHRSGAALPIRSPPRQAKEPSQRHSCARIRL